MTDASSTATQCNGCKYATTDRVFDLCNHETSAYTSNEKVLLHTRTHMIRLQGGNCKNYTEK